MSLQPAAIHNRRKRTTAKRLQKIDDEARNIYNFAASKISAFMEKEYSQSSEGTLPDQIGDFHLFAERACVYLMGNVLALLDPSVEDEAILTLNKHIRSMTRTIRQMTPDPNIKPS